MILRVRFTCRALSRIAGYSEVVCVVARDHRKAALPSTPAEMRSCCKDLFASRARVHVDFHAHRNFDNFWSLPSHFRSPLAPNGSMPHQATIELGSKRGKQTLNARVLEIVPTGFAKRWRNDKDGHGLRDQVGSRQPARYSKKQGRAAPTIT
jgi:hypothetical protein